jgi:quinol monooxygenase YgiN
MRNGMTWFLLATGAAMLGGCATKAMTRGEQGMKATNIQPVVARLWELEVDPKRLSDFKVIGAENQEASTRTEPGVMMMHAVHLADAPTHVRVLEVYANQSAYEAHIRTPHFAKYKAASAEMVKSQKLVPVEPIRLCAKGGTIGPVGAKGLMVRIAVISVDPKQIDAYKAFLTEEQEASVRREPGVLMLHSVQYADDPTQIRLFEVYASRAAYQTHIRTPHFLKYKTGTEKMVTALELPLAVPILLAAKADQAGSICGE